MPTPPDRNTLIALLARGKREQMRKNWLHPRMTPLQRISTERAIRSKAREYVSNLRERRVIHVDKDCWLRNIRKSYILDYYFPERNNAWIRPHNRARFSQSIDVENLNIHDNPDGVFRFFSELSESEALCSEVRINFKDEFCNDIVPFLILAEIRPSLLPVFSGGAMSPRVQKVLLALRLDRPLGMTFSRKPDRSDVWALPLRQRYPRNTSNSPLRYENPTTGEIVADDLCEEFDKWLDIADPGLGLTREGRAHIKMMAGELLDNAERHSAPDTKDGDWSLAAFMGRRTDEAGRIYYRCHIGFLSAGATFAESLKHAPPQIAARISEYVTHARRDGSAASESTLATLVALQDGVTRDQSAFAAKRGGTGLQEVLEFVSELGQTSDPLLQPKITIVSGQSCIALRPPYMHGTRSGDTCCAPRELWCNETNDGTKAPDSAFVFDLDRGFPGTVISIAFTLDPEYLTNVA